MMRPSGQLVAPGPWTPDHEVHNMHDQLPVRRVNTASCSAQAGTRQKSLRRFHHWCVSLVLLVQPERRR